MEDHKDTPAQPVESTGNAAGAAPEFELHESAAIFPPMRESEFAALVADIREKGQLEPVWTYQGKVIDGRHRLRACKQLGLAPRTREWDGNGSLLEFIVSANIRRRHLKENQRAMVAARMLPHFEAEAQTRMHHTEEGEGGPGENSPQGRSSDVVGKIINVSGYSVKCARKLLVAGIPELIGRVDAGTLAVSLASKLAELPADEQTRLVNLSRAEITLAIRERQPATEPKPKTAAQLQEEQKIAKLIADTQIGKARLVQTPQGLRLELTHDDCLNEFFRLNRDRYHLLDLLERGVFIVRTETYSS